MTLSIMAYIGSKRLAVPQLLPILRKFHANFPHAEYRELFVGGGSVALAFLRPGMRAWLNDSHTGVACLWTAVHRWPEQLAAMIPEVRSNKRLYQQFCQELQEEVRPECNSEKRIREHAFKKLAVHCWSRDGLGEIARFGNRRGVERWTYAHRSKCIFRAHKILSQVRLRITALDYSHLLRESTDGIIYADPPYFGIDNLYSKKFAPEDHERLARDLDLTANPWLLSYNARQEVKSLYKWAHIEEITVFYQQYRRLKTEFRIMNPTYSRLFQNGSTLPISAVRL
jgi:site-specific DNA-adenine methylase